MKYKVEHFGSIGEYREFLDQETNVTIVSVNITNYVYDGLQTDIYVTYYRNEV